VKREGSYRIGGKKMRKIQVIESWAVDVEEISNNGR